MNFFMSLAELSNVMDFAGLFQYSASCPGLPEQQPLVPDV